MTQRVIIHLNFKLLCFSFIFLMQQVSGSKWLVIHWISSNNYTFDSDKEHDFESFLGCGFTPAPIRRLRFRVKWPDTCKLTYRSDESILQHWVDHIYSSIVRLITNLWDRSRVHSFDPNYTHELVKENCPYK